MRTAFFVSLSAFVFSRMCFFFPGLFPAVLNLASMADITANATCGSMGPEMFCKLVEHVPGQPVKNPQCRICNQKSTKPFGKDSHTHTRLDKVITVINHARLVN